jgi:CRISPR-associated protein Cas1
MIKRTVDISTRGTYLSVKMDQLIIHQDKQVVGRIPIEDIGVLLLDTESATYSHAVVCRVLENGGVLVACDKSHHPCGLLLPSSNSLQVERLHQQIEASKPLKKRLWQQLVSAKIRHQASLMKDATLRKRLRGYAAKVKSGDTDNREAVAARAYWPALLGKDFRRDREGNPPNNLLNYGYMALRALVARAVSAAGLHPSLGLHHVNRSNSFCLADDLLEPLRPLVDKEVRALSASGCEEVNKESKRALLGLLVETVEFDGNAGPLAIAVERMVASLVKCYQGESRALEIPKLWI